MSLRNHDFLDAHLHLYPPRRLSGLIRWMHSFFPAHPVPKEATLEDVLADLRAQEYQNFVALAFPLEPGESSSLNEFIGQTAARVPGLVPFGGVHLEDESPAAVADDAILRFKLAGLKFHPMVQRFDPCNSRLFPVFERMNDWRKPVYIHTGFDEWYGYSLPVESLRTLLEQYPNIPFVFCHMLFPRLEIAFELAEEYANLYLDATNVFGAIAMLGPLISNGMQMDIAKARESIEKNCRRIMFGTDHPAGMGDIPQILREFFDFGLSDAATGQILNTTASLFLQRHCGTYYIGKQENP